MFVPLPVPTTSPITALQEVNFATSFNEPYCCVLVMQHFWQCGSSLIVFSTDDPLHFEVWKCPIPWHSLCFPQHWDLCEQVAYAQLDPFDFVRRKGSWPGKVLFCFSTEPDEDEFHFRSFTDVWTYNPSDPVPLVPCPPSAGPVSSPRTPVLIPGSPIWTVHRCWDVAVPSRFWESKEQEYLMRATDAMAPMYKLEELALATIGKLSIRDVVPRPVPDDPSDYETLLLY